MESRRSKRNVYHPLLLVILCVSCSDGQIVTSSTSGALVATIQSGGLQGNVEFIPDTQGTFIRVLLRGGTYGEKLRWKIHEFPTELGSDQQCLDEKIGRTFVDFTAAHGTLTAGQDASFMSKLQLVSGKSSINGRTLVLRSPDTGRLACAIVQPSSRIRTYQARFFSPIGGRALIRQSSFGTTVLTQLWHTNGTRRDSISKWTIVQSQLGSREISSLSLQHGYNECLLLQSDVSLSEPDEKTAYVAIGRSPKVVTGRTFHMLTSAPQLESSGRNFYIVLYSDFDISSAFACAKLVAVEPRQAVAKFSAEVTGEISFRQESPFDPTLVTVNFGDLNRKAYSYGIDELPLIFRGDRKEVCPNVRGVIYNPLKKTPDAVPEPNKGSVDQYAIGDLSGKYGPLMNRDKHFQQVYDQHLSLFGVHSVVGRAVVVYSPTGTSIACANIELTGRRLITAFATFDYPLQGQVILRQDRDDSASDTSIYLELSYPSGVSKSKTYHHPWHINERAIPTGERFSLSGSDCFQAGEVFNPYNISKGDTYECYCSGQTSENCELGDCSKKLGFLDIPPFGVQGDKQEIARYYFTDPHLPLIGTSSVIGRAVVIHGPDYSGNRLACANIFEHVNDYSKK